jgi:membrane peptidoglycan carboxypeptidase
MVRQSGWTGRSTYEPPTMPIPRPIPRHRRRPRLRWLRRLGTSLMAVAVLALAAGAVLWVATPPVNDLEQRVTDRLAAHGLSQGSPPVNGRVALALIATEDSRFYQHPGIDVYSLPRAALALVQRQGDLGGATLDQQLAKVIYSPVRTDLVAKMEQAVLAMKLDSTYSKPTILQAYLNAVYFGHGYYGLADATQGYFGVAPDQVSWAQASLIAGLVQAPSAYDPLNHLDLAKQRQRHVLDRLVAAGALSSAQANAVFAAPLQLRNDATTPATS